MKKLYIPKGETRRYESVESGNIVVEGCLKVDGTVKARHISGHGVIEAGALSAHTVTAMDVEAAHIVAETLTAERVCAVEVHISGAAAVSCRLEAQLVEAGKLTVAGCEIGELRCDDVVNLPAKHRSLLGTLLASFFRTLWCSWFCRAPEDGKERVMDAVWTPQNANQPEQAAQPEQAETAAQAEAPQDDPVAEPGGPAFSPAYQDLEDDFEFKRLAGLYRLNKGRGFYLRLFPLEAAAGQTPEPLLPDEAVWPAA